MTYKQIKYGDLLAHQFVVFEHKKLFGCLFFYFKGQQQDRFHTHAFNAISFKLFGTYSEGIFNPVTKEVSYLPRTSFIKYFPRNSYHSINDSKGCCTFLLQGPWGPTWLEYQDGRETVLHWHRKVDK